MTIANLFTIIRLLLAPILLWAFSTSDRWIVILILSMAAFTDFLDGWVARKFNQISMLGKILDPIADKLTVGFSLLGLAIWKDFPFWVAIIYFIKEALQIFGGAYLYYKRAEIQSSNLWGKAGTFLFFTGFFLYFWLETVGIACIGLGFFVSFIALCTYTKAALNRK